jgi:hypothetical protein
LNKALATRGRQARQRAQDTAGGGRIPASAWYPSLTWLEDLGYTRAQIAEAVGLQERRIREILRWGREEGSAMVTIDKPTVPKDQLAPEFQAMLEFTPEAFQDFYEYFEGRPLPKHCQTWIDLFINHRNLMINIPPRHMKSSIFSKWLPVWLLCINRDELILIVSKTGTLARLWAADIAQELEFGEVPKIFGRFAPERKGEVPWRPGQGEMLVLGRTRATKGQQYSILAKGSGQQVLGHEATVVICDDPTDARIAKSEVKNKDQMEWFREQVLSRIENPTQLGGAAGRAVIIGQRVHFMDMYGQIAEQRHTRGPKAGQQLWHVVTDKAVKRWPELVDESDAEVLWPEKWPYTELMIQYERVGGLKPFETMFQQNPLPDEAKLVRPEWWERCRQYDRNGGTGVREARGERFLPVTRVVSLDPSPKRYNGLIVADVLYDRTRFDCTVLEARHFQGGLRDIFGELEGVISTYIPDYLIIEFSTFATWMKEDPIYQRMKDKLRIIPHSTGSNKADPELGLESMAFDVESGSIHLPYGDAWGKEMSMNLEKEFNVWPYGMPEPGDDMMMALWFIKWNYRKMVPPSVFETTSVQRLGGVPAHLKGGYHWLKKGSR